MSALKYVYLTPLIVSIRILAMMAGWRLSSDEEKIAYCTNEQVVAGDTYIALELEDRYWLRTWKLEEEV